MDDGFEGNLALRASTRRSSIDPWYRRIYIGTTILHLSEKNENETLPRDTPEGQGFNLDR